MPALSTLPSRLMNKKTAVNQPIANAADYVDALTRPQSKNLMVKKRIFAGRRMRDENRSVTVVTEVVKRLA